MDRREVLLLAAFNYLKEIEDNFSDCMCYTVFYDSADCDGYCLKTDIANELDIPED